MVKNKGFYEEYWQREGGAVPESDSTTGERKALLAQALRPLSKGAKMLDAGCGSGEFVEFIKELGFDVSGVDISKTAVEKARARCPGTPFWVKSLEDRLPFKDDEFDVVWATEVLEHIFEIHSTLSEINRVLKDGGLFILTVPYHGLIKNLAVALLGFDNHYNPDISHIRFFTLKTLEGSLRKSGFETVSWCGVGRLWPFYKSMFVVARKTSVPEKTEICG